MPKFVNLIAFLQKLILKEHVVVIMEFPDWVQFKMKIQKMAYFPKYSTFFNLQKTPKFLEIEQNCRCQNWRKLSIFRKFLSILRLARLFYIIYIKKNL